MTQLHTNCYTPTPTHRSRCHTLRCQAVIKTGKRSGEICLHKIRMNTEEGLYCGYHSGRMTRSKSTLRSTIISEEVRIGDLLDLRFDIEERLTKIAEHMERHFESITNSVSIQINNLSEFFMEEINSLR